MYHCDLMIQCNTSHFPLSRAILSSIVIANSVQQEGGHICRGAILSGAAYPAPYNELLTGLTPGCFSNSLHCIGENDDVNPPADARKIKDLLGGSEIVHNNGHTLPLDTESISKYNDFLKKIVLGIEQTEL